MSTAAVVPVFDETGGSLARTLEGLANQTAAPEEIVVVDDASARPLTMPGVDVLRLPQNGGLSQARNEGAANTDAAYLLFVNCDVVLTPDWLERGLAYSERASGNGRGGRADRARRRPAGPARLAVAAHRAQGSTARRLPGRRRCHGWSGMPCSRAVTCSTRSAASTLASARLGEDWNFSERVRASGRRVVHLPELVARQPRASPSIDGLARKSLRNARGISAVSLPGSPAPEFDRCAGSRRRSRSPAPCSAELDATCSKAGLPSCPSTSRSPARALRSFG